MWKALFVVAFVVVPHSVVAQHPCDVPNPTEFREPGSKLPQLNIGFCFSKQDADGDPVAEPIGFALQLNGGPLIDLGVLQPLTPPNAKGEQYYETRPPALAAGIMTVIAYNSQGQSPASAPITLTLLGPPKYPTAVILKPKLTR